VIVSLRQILAVLDDPTLDGNLSAVVTGVTHDSRAVKPGWIFVAMPGEKADGHDFIHMAVAAGAGAVIAQRPRSGESDSSVPWITVFDTRKVLGPVAAVVYGSPSTKMVLVGITGTNGKTSLTFLLESIVKAAGGSPGVIGTVSYRWGDQEQAAPHTTPEASDLQHMLARMAQSGVSHCLMEVSSHGLHLGRLEGCQFDVGVFTNLTQDHLDYHGNLEDYFLAKRILFSRLLPSSVKTAPAAVVNLDDAYGRRLAGEMGTIRMIGYGSDDGCQVRASEVSLEAQGIEATLETPRGPINIRTRLTGAFNLENVVASVAVAEALGIPHHAVRQGVESLKVVPGRLERIPSDRRNVFVDYAHTPNALKNVLAALQIVRSGRIITVMGCGGDRDKTKRPIMGMEAAAGSDFVVVTSDNPRSEDPLVIIGQVECGVREYGFSVASAVRNGQPLPSRGYLVIADRREALAWAVRHMQDDDILLVAGKGHETYQEIDGVRYPFDDREILREELHKLSSSCAAPAGGCSTMYRTVHGPESERSRP
jgi:UDP-N-acetylmuramoyl-L-alanyl-D-glutamate--2,6-diaminopimelate ligase